LLFYQSIAEFKNLEDSEERRLKSISIMKDFFDADSPYELNIQASDIEDCKKKFEEFKETEFPKTFFDELMRKILNMLKIEEYNKFITSKHFEDYYRKYGYEVFIQMQEQKWKSDDNEFDVDCEIDSDDEQEVVQQ
jgi:hypothetical protein